MPQLEVDSMGALYQFDCRACGYVAEVSGGSDVGEIGRTVTISCATCKKLRDAIVPGLPGTDDHVTSELACPPCPSSRTRVHETTRWEHPGPCPRCGTPLTRGDLTVLWD